MSPAEIPVELHQERTSTGGFTRHVQVVGLLPGPKWRVVQMCDPTMVWETTTEEVQRRWPLVVTTALRERWAAHSLLTAMADALKRAKLTRAEGELRTAAWGVPDMIGARLAFRALTGPARAAVPAELREKIWAGLVEVDQRRSHPNRPATVRVVAGASDGTWKLAIRDRATSAEHWIDEWLSTDDLLDRWPDVVKAQAAPAIAATAPDVLRAPAVEVRAPEELDVELPGAPTQCPRCIARAGAAYKGPCFCATRHEEADRLPTFQPSNLAREQAYQKELDRLRAIVHAVELTHRWRMTQLSGVCLDCDADGDAAAVAVCPAASGEARQVVQDAIARLRETALRAAGWRPVPAEMLTKWAGTANASDWTPPEDRENFWDFARAEAEMIRRASVSGSAVGQGSDFRSPPGAAAAGDR